MEIILKEDIHRLGYKDDIVKVKAGYGRNYLIPQGKAIVASESAKKVLAENLKQRKHKLEKIKSDAEELAAQINGLKLSIPTKVSSTGKIFGSVGSIQLADALAKQGFSIDRKVIAIDGTVEAVGEYKAVAKLHREVKAEFTFEVVEE